jgi:hypothetical protein
MPNLSAFRDPVRKPDGFGRHAQSGQEWRERARAGKIIGISCHGNEAASRFLTGLWGPLVAGEPSCLHLA